jgi:hypothetical protein
VKLRQPPHAHRSKPLLRYVSEIDLLLLIKAERRQHVWPSSHFHFKINDRPYSHWAFFPSIHQLNTSSLRHLVPYNMETSVPTQNRSGQASLWQTAAIRWNCNQANYKKQTRRHYTRDLYPGSCWSSCSCYRLSFSSITASIRKVISWITGWNVRNHISQIWLFVFRDLGLKVAGIDLDPSYSDNSLSPAALVRNVIFCSGNKFTDLEISGGGLPETSFDGSRRSSWMAARLLYFL